MLASGADLDLSKSGLLKVIDKPAPLCNNLARACEIAGHRPLELASRSKRSNCAAHVNTHSFETAAHLLIF